MVRPAAALLLLSSCTVLFDPSKVKCLQTPPAAKGPFGAIAGDDTSLTFEWPALPSDAGAGGYRVCFGADSKVSGPCRKVGVDHCAAGLCQYTLDGPDAGLAYNTRVWAKLFGEDPCGEASDPAAAPVLSVTPVNGNFHDNRGMTVLTGCDAGVQADGGLLVIAQQSGLSCVSAVGLGDDQWQNATIDVEVRTFGSALAGVAARVPVFVDDHAQRLAVLLSPAPNVAESVAITRRQPNDFDKPVATSVAPVSDGVWRALRVSLLDAGVSVALGDVGATPTEVLRWTDPSPVAGQFGLALVGILSDVTAHFRNLRVHTQAVVPEGGPTSAQWTFSGTNAFTGIRRVGAAMGAGCPTAFTAAGDCNPASACLPSSGSQCLQLDSSNGNAFASFDLPVGIDPSKPWHVKFKFAPQVGGVMNPSLLRTTIAPINANAFTGFNGQPLLDVNGSLWTFPVRVFEMAGENLGTLTPTKWHLLELEVDPGAGTYTAKLDGMPHSGGYPAALGPHLGALQLGGAGDLHGYYSDLEVAQP